MKWVNVLPVSIIDLYLRSPSWLWWMKLLDIIWNWSLLTINFSINLSSVFKRMIGLNDLGVLYNALLGFGMMIVVEDLKWVGQHLTSMYVFAILIIFPKYNLSLRIHLRCLHDSLSGPRTDELLHLAIVWVNSSSENWFQSNDANNSISSRMFLSV